LKKLLYFILLPLIILGTYSCEEQSSEIDFNPNVLTAKDYIRAEDALFEIVNAFLKGIHDTLVHETGYAYIDFCDVVYNQPENTMKFSYGLVNRLCDDNKFRRGLFCAEFTGVVFNKGVKALITTDSLFVDDFLTEASIEIENLGFNSQNKVRIFHEGDFIQHHDTGYIQNIGISDDNRICACMGRGLSHTGHP
jgi:hypothetical protein